MAESSKKACGGDCGCSAPKDPYQESLQAVWHDPTSYDPVKHGPSYLPKSAPRQVTAAQKGEARKFAADQVHPKVAEALFEESLNPLVVLLAMLRAASMVHQTHHWQTSGGHYYADHLLFERLYNESQDFIDQVAERAIGSTGAPGVVDVQTQVELMETFVGWMCDGSLDADAMVASSLNAENLIVSAVSVVISKLEASGNLSNGTDNLLQGVSDLHEQFVYLLKQRSSKV